MNAENENLRVWNKFKVELLEPNFRENDGVTMALVKAVGRIKLVAPVARVIPRGKSFLVPVSDLGEVEE